MYATEQGVINGQWNAAEAAFQAEILRSSPHVLMRPQIMADGDTWIALYGENLQSGVSGMGSTPQEACADFDRAWREEITPRAHILARTDAAASLNGAVDDVLSERFRQIAEEGWTPDHDDSHTDNELSRAAACYCIGNLAYWPWDLDWWKPTDHRGNLIKAAALCIAEIERLDRIGQAPAKMLPLPKGKNAKPVIEVRRPRNRSPSA